MLTIERRGKMPLNISLPDFDKGHRCPGWSGEGWKYNPVDWCDGALPHDTSRWALTVREGARPPVGVQHATDLPGFFSWRLRRTVCCNTLVLPQLTYWFALGSWVVRDGSRLRPGSAVSHLTSAVRWSWWFRSAARKRA